MGGLHLLVFAAVLQACSSNFVYFPTTASKTSIIQLDVSSATPQHTTLLEYPKGQQNPGGGATGICRLGNSLYWGDQTTGTVHSAELSSGRLTNHNSSFIAGLADPQGVACDAGDKKVYVVDSIPGAGLRGVFFRSVEAGSPTTQLDVNAAALRSIKMVEGDLWFGADDGIYSSVQEKPGSANLTVIPGSSGKIYEDFEVVDFKGAKPLIFANIYDWGGMGVLESELNPKHMNLTFQPLKGAGCQRGSELTWGLSADTSTKVLYWVVVDDQSHMRIMYKNYDSTGPAKVAYSGAGSGYGIYFDSVSAGSVLV